MTEPADFLLRLRSGDEVAFRELVGRLHRSLIGVALGFVGSRASAEEVVQDTWLSVVEGLPGFEGRSSLKNWIFGILVNKAKTRAVRDRRTVAVGSIGSEPVEDEPIVSPARFDAAGMWKSLPALWDDVTPERIVAGRQLWSHIAEAIEGLPTNQRSVLVLREVEHLEAGVVADMLGITAANQRVLLHRARARIRDFLERLLGG